MPRKRITGKRKQRIEISEGMLEFLNGKPLRECDLETRQDSYFWWSSYPNGLTGVVEFAKAEGLMPKRTPREVKRHMDWEAVGKGVK